MGVGTESLGAMSTIDERVQDFVERGRQHPDRCAFCGKPRQLLIHLTTLDDTGTRVEVDEPDFPVCEPCLYAYLQFAGQEAAVSFVKETGNAAD